jgi:hypothetical protein
MSATLPFAASLVASVTELQAVVATNLPNGQPFWVANLNQTIALFRWTTGVAGTEDGQLLVTPTTGAASGRFVRADNHVVLKLPWAFNTADNTTLITCPTGIRLHVMRTVPEAAVALTGLDTASIGLTATASLNPGGLGTITGQLAGFCGTMGAENTTPQRTMLVAGDTLKHNVLVAGYTGGSGFWHVVASLIQV